MRKWLKIVEELFKSKVNQDAIAAFTKKKILSGIVSKIETVSPEKPLLPESRFWHSLLSGSAFCLRSLRKTRSHRPVVNILDPAKLRPIDRIARVGLEISSSLPVDSAGNISRTIGHHSIRKLLLSSCVLSNA